MVGLARASTPTITSPICNPAFIAGDCEPFNVGTTEPTIGCVVVTSPKKKTQEAKIATAMRKCTPGPQKMTRARCQIGLDP